MCDTDRMFVDGFEDVCVESFLVPVDPVNLEELSWGDVGGCHGRVVVKFDLKPFLFLDELVQLSAIGATPTANEFRKLIHLGVYSQGVMLTMLTKGNSIN